MHSILTCLPPTDYALVWSLGLLHTGLWSLFFQITETAPTLYSLFQDPYLSVHCHPNQFVTFPNIYHSLPNSPESSYHVINSVMFQFLVINSSKHFVQLLFSYNKSTDILYISKYFFSHDLFWEKAIDF